MDLFLKNRKVLSQQPLNTLFLSSLCDKIILSFQHKLDIFNLHPIQFHQYDKFLFNSCGTDNQSAKNFINDFYNSQSFLQFQKIFFSIDLFQSLFSHILHIFIPYLKHFLQLSKSLLSQLGLHPHLIYL